MFIKIIGFIKKRYNIFLQLFFALSISSLYLITFLGVKVQVPVYFIISICLVLLFEKAFYNVSKFYRTIIKICLALGLGLNFIIQVNILPFLVSNRIGHNDSVIIFGIAVLTLTVFSRSIIKLFKKRTRFIDFAGFLSLTAFNLLIGIIFYTFILYFFLPRNMNLLNCLNNTKERQIWYIDLGGIQGKFLYEYKITDLLFASINTLENSKKIIINNVCGE